MEVRRGKRERDVLGGVLNILFLSKRGPPLREGDAHGIHDGKTRKRDLASREAKINFFSVSFD